jgi:hypothetical protein
MFVSLPPKNIELIDVYIKLGVNIATNVVIFNFPT